MALAAKLETVEAVELTGAWFKRERHHRPDLLRKKDMASFVTEHIYRRGTTAPAAPSGGFSDEHDTPSGWTRTPLSATSTEHVYRSSRILNYIDEAVEGEDFTEAVSVIAQSPLLNLVHRPH